MSDSYIVRSKSQWDVLFGWLRKIPLQTQHGEPAPVEVTWGVPKTARSLDQNALSHVWYAKISRVKGEYTPEQIHRRCKYHQGIPILREDPEFSEMIEHWLAGLPDWGVLTSDHEPVRYRAMDLLAVTSVMTRPQMSRYLEHVYDQYSDVLGDQP